MSAPSITRAQLLKLRPCRDRLAAVDAAFGPKWKRATAADARAAGLTYSDLLWVIRSLAEHDPTMRTRLIGFARDCAAHVLPIFEARHPTDLRPRQALINPTKETAAAASVADASAAYAAYASYAAAAASAAASASAAAASAAAASYAASASYAAASAANYAASAASYAAVAAASYADAAAASAASDAAAAAERAWQFDRLVAWFSDPLPTPLPLPPHPTAFDEGMNP